MKFKLTLIVAFIVIVFSGNGQTVEKPILGEYKRVTTTVYLPSEFPDGYTAWNDYLVKNLDTSLISLKAAPVGNYTVPVTYTIDRDGRIKDVVASKDPGYGTAEEVLRVIKNYTERIPVLSDGKSVEYHVKQFIQFKVVNEKIIEIDDNKVFTSVQIEAEFPGGLVAWKRFLERNLNQSVPYQHGAPAGRYTVMLSFEVDKEGAIRDVKAENNPGYGTAEEAIRVLKKGPNFIPFQYNGRIVAYRGNQAITFVVN